MRKTAQRTNHNKTDRWTGWRGLFLILVFIFIAAAEIALLGGWLTGDQAARSMLAPILVAGAAGSLLAACGWPFYFRSKKTGVVHSNTTPVVVEREPKPRTAAPAPPRDMTNIVAVSFTDRLTGLGNRARFFEKLKTVFAEHSVLLDETKKVFAVGIININGMKSINELYGTNGGDELISQCANRLRTSLENAGFFFRYQGDEFAIILPGAKDMKSVIKTGGMLQEVLQAPFDILGSSVRVSGSFGFALYPEGGDTPDKIMTNVETALHHSKQKGKARITVYSQELKDTIRENAVMEQALYRAIAANKVTPHFQPIISLQDGKLLGFEALARWSDRLLGSVPPGRFIPLAEERGMIVPLTEALLFQAARAAAEWPADLYLSFNLSPAQIIDLNTSSSILNTIKRAGLEPHRLEIEVTETATISNPEAAAEIIATLHDAGVRISMDDFGTGQSSLGRLRDLKIDKVKIDRAFIKAIGKDKPAEHIVNAILEMCAGLNLTVVAEGIEEMGQAERLKRFGCHAGQGYLFGKPLDAYRTMGYIREFQRSALSGRAGVRASH